MSVPAMQVKVKAKKLYHRSWALTDTVNSFSATFSQ